VPPGCAWLRWRLHSPPPRPGAARPIPSIARGRLLPTARPCAPTGCTRVTRSNAADARGQHDTLRATPITAARSGTSTARTRAPLPTSSARGCPRSGRSEPSPAARRRTPPSRCSWRTVTARALPGSSSCTRAPLRRSERPSASTRSRPGCSGAAARGWRRTRATWPTSAKPCRAVPVPSCAPA
jgi:hypothetical protein